MSTADAVSELLLAIRQFWTLNADPRALRRALLLLLAKIGDAAGLKLIHWPA